MNILPSALVSSKKPLPMPKTSLISSSSTMPSSGTSKKPEVMPNAINAMRRGETTISHISSTPEILPDAKKPPKVGRPSKAEKLKEAKSKISESISELLAKDPGKKDIRAYFEARIKSF